MKIDRLIGIIATLQKKGKVTAPYLAEKFEVSRRTINRDIEDICRAGIPILTTQGEGGGISIMEGFSLDTTVFTGEELEAVFAGLKSIDSVSDTSWSERLSRKMQEIPGGMSIDLASFYKGSLEVKISFLKQAIKDKNLVSFHYYYPKGEADKTIEPYLVVYKWTDWYVYGFCRDRQNFRMYKLRRLWDLKLIEEGFSLREMPDEPQRFGSNLTDDIIVAAAFDPSVKYRLVEEYGPDSFAVMEDGRLYGEYGFSGNNVALSWILAFGDMAEVISPDEIKAEIKRVAGKIYKKYK